MNDELCKSLEKDLGKNAFSVKLYEIMGVLHEIDSVCSSLSEWAKDEIVDTPVHLAPSRSKIAYEPLGVALILGAWNFPVIITLKACVNAIAAGNCVVAKPSESAPQSMFAMCKLFDEYMDKNFFVCLAGGLEIGKKLT